MGKGFDFWGRDRGVTMIAPAEIIHQKQPCKHSCFSACIAMLIGEPVKKVISDMMKIGLGPPLLESEGMAKLVQNNILPVRRSAVIGSVMESGRLYLVTVLNDPGRLHSVLMVNLDGVFNIFDPNECKMTQNVEKYLNRIIFLEALYDCESGVSR